ncbi:MAG: FHA domain-containing protein [Leptospiraceae bacterium]|nr:FHA domain-containing protein [Leptospiraceae bacterium]
MKFISLILSALIFPMAIFSDSKVQLEKVDANKYPMVHIYMQENKAKPLQGESIHITETREGFTRQIQTISILKSNQLRPIRLILSIQASNELDRLQYSKQLAATFVQSLSKEDKVGIHIYGRDTYFLNLNMDKVEALEKIDSISQGSGNRTNFALNFLYSQMREDELPNLLFVISTDKEVEVDEPIASVIKKSKALKFPIHMLALSEKKYLSLAEYSEGEFYPIEKNTSIAAMQSQLYSFRKTPPIIEYKSPFAESAKPLRSSSVQISLKVGENDFKANYDLTLMTFAKSKFSNIEFFYSFMFIILFICILLLYAVNKRNKARAYAEEMRLREEELLKNDLYYHENISADTLSTPTFKKYSSYEESEESKEDDSDDLYSYDEDSISSSTATIQKPESSFQENSYEVSPDVLEKGESYERGILILKEGPNPGRQFTINKPEITIGSTASNDLVLWDSSLSPMHAKIKRVKNVFIIFDTVSNSGVFLNGKKLLRPKALFDFDEIRIGNSLLLFRGK